MCSETGEYEQSKYNLNQTAIILLLLQNCKEHLPQWI